MPLNNGFYNMLVDNETKNDLVYLFVGVFPYLGKIGNLNQITYFETKNKENFIVSIIESAFTN